MKLKPTRRRVLSRKISPRMLPGIIRRIKAIKMFLMDVDGVMTDGGIILGDSGLEMKRFNIQDGMGIDMAVRSGLRLGIITGRESDLVRRRALELGIPVVKQGYYDKSIALNECLTEQNLSESEVGYIGDDLLDLCILTRVGFGVAPANAVPEVKKAVHYVCHSSGGHGAVREAIELILTVRGEKDTLLEEYTNHPFPNVKKKDLS